MDMSSSFAAFNIWAVVGAALASFLVGGIWYGPLFGRAWMSAFNLSEEDLASRSVARTFGLSLLLALVAACNLELFVGAQGTLSFGLTAGFLTGAGWVATLLGILYLFEMQSLKAYLINAGYCTVALTVMGAIVGTW